MSIATGAGDDNVLDTSARSTNTSSNQLSPRDELLTLLARALDRQADTIFLEAGHGTGRVKARTDNQTHTLAEVGPEKLQQFINMVASSACVPAHQFRNHPTSGRLPVIHKRKRLDCPVTFAPGVSGVSAAIRTPPAAPPALDEIGFEPDQLPAVRRGLDRTPGLIVVAGQTGSGKTATAEAFLSELGKNSDLSIIQVGDPVEHHSDRRTQLQLGKDLTWKAAVDAALNFRPDVLEVGEVRTTEQAKITADAATRGPLVICTVHAASASAAITRLLRLGVEGQTLSVTLKMIVAQKLVPQLCPDCRHAASASEPGCDSCRQTGYRGRTLVAEVLNVTPEVSGQLERLAGGDRIVKHAVTKDGMVTMEEVERRKAGRGLVRPPATEEPRG